MRWMFQLACFFFCTFFLYVSSLVPACLFLRGLFFGAVGLALTAHSVSQLWKLCK
jgi:hypothetical protein